MKVLNYNKSIIAKKTHKCFLCHFDIKPFDSYSKSTICDDNVIYDIKVHHHCYNISIMLGMFDDLELDEGLDHEGFVELIKESYFAIVNDYPEATLDEMIEFFKHYE